MQRSVASSQPPFGPVKAPEGMSFSIHRCLHDKRGVLSYLSVYLAGLPNGTARARFSLSCWGPLIIDKNDERVCLGCSPLLRAIVRMSRDSRLELVGNSGLERRGKASYYARVRMEVRARAQLIYIRGPNERLLETPNRVKPKFSRARISNRRRNSPLCSSTRLATSRTLMFLQSGWAAPCRACKRQPHSASVVLPAEVYPVEAAFGARSIAWLYRHSLPACIAARASHWTHLTQLSDLGWGSWYA